MTQEKQPQVQEQESVNQLGTNVNQPPPSGMTADDYSESAHAGQKPNGSTEVNQQTIDSASACSLTRKYSLPCYGGPSGNGSSFQMSAEEYTKLMVKEKKYSKIGQKILDLAGVKLNGDRPFDLKVNHPSMMQRVIQKGSLGLGEAYMEGWWDTQDFYSLHLFFEKILRGGIEYYFPNNAMDLANVLKARLINPQTKKKSKKVGLMHYDMGNDFFESMLGKYMQYSCGYWVHHKHESELTAADRERIKTQQERSKSFNGDTDGFVYGYNNDESVYRANCTATNNHMYAVPITDLAEAQLVKLRMIGDKLRLKPGMEVLDVGCGWGGLALYLAEHYQVKVVGITISEEQKKTAEQMTEAFRSQVTILNTDYRDIQKHFQQAGDEPKKQFDRIVSVGMFEHVGPKNYKKFFEVMRGLLKSDDPEAVMLLHTIGSNRSMESADQWYLKYIFPGGCLPAITNIGKYLEGSFVVEDVHNFGYHYYLTLLAWRENFLKYWVAHNAMPANVKRKQLNLTKSTHRPNSGADRSGVAAETASPSSTPNISSREEMPSSNEEKAAKNPILSNKDAEREKDDREVFFRMFYYYLSSSAGAFKARDLQLWQFVLSPNGVRGYVDVPRP